MTALFYTAVHDVSAFLADRRQVLRAKGVGFPGTHKEIKRVLRDHWPQLAPGYESLLDRSWRARYRGKTYAESDLGLAELQLQMLRSELAQAT